MLIGAYVSETIYVIYGNFMYSAFFQLSFSASIKSILKRTLPKQDVPSAKDMPENSIRSHGMHVDYMPRRSTQTSSIPTHSMLSHRMSSCIKSGF